MTERSSFFNSIAGDRKYQASDYARYFGSFITKGVFPSPTTNLQVLANGTMSVTLSPGPAWMMGYYYLNDASLILPLEVADGVLNRIDRIVIRMSTIDRSIIAAVKKGVFATIPVAPVLQRDADVYELGVADVYITNGALTIIQANITDTRMETTLCGWVNSTIQVDTTAIFNQYQDWYTARQAEYNADFLGWTTDKQNAYTIWTDAKQGDYDAWYLLTTVNAEADVSAFEAQFQADFTIWFNSVKDQITGDLGVTLTAAVVAIKGTGWIDENLVGLSEDLLDLAGAGRTTETVKANAVAIAATNVVVNAHLADEAQYRADTKFLDLRGCRFIG